MRRLGITAIAVGLTALVAGAAPAGAQDRDEDTDHLITPMGMGVSMGGGVTEFSGETLDDVTDLGGAWDVRVEVGTRRTISLEAAYVGTAQEIEALGLGGDPTLNSNGLEAAARFNLGNIANAEIGGVQIDPFVAGGLGFAYYNIQGDSFNSSSVNDDDNVLTVPLTAGVAAGYDRFFADARFTWRETFDEDLVQGGGSSLDNWALTGRLGVEF
jgi:hypothetical protein